MMSGKRCSRLSAVALGVALGIISGLCMLAMGIAAWKGNFGADIVNHWATMYPGITVSLKGSLVAGAWGFLEGFIFGLILAWIYNLCLCCCSRSHCGCCNASCPKCTDTTVVIEKK